MQCGVGFVRFNHSGVWLKILFLTTLSSSDYLNCWSTTNQLTDFLSSIERRLRTLVALIISCWSHLLSRTVCNYRFPPWGDRRIHSQTVSVSFQRTNSVLMTMQWEGEKMVQLNSCISLLFSFDFDQQWWWWWQWLLMSCITIHVQSCTTAYICHDSFQGIVIIWRSGHLELSACRIFRMMESLLLVCCKYRWLLLINLFVFYNYCSRMIYCWYDNYCCAFSAVENIIISQLENTEIMHPCETSFVIVMNYICLNLTNDLELCINYCSDGKALVLDLSKL